MLYSSCQPHAIIVRGCIAFVAQCKDNFVSYVNCQAAKHGTSLRRCRNERLQHKLVWGRLAFDRKGSFADNRALFALVHGCGKVKSPLKPSLNGASSRNITLLSVFAGCAFVS